MKNPKSIKNHEISIDYVNTGGVQNRNKMKIMDKICSYFVACEIVNGSEDLNQDPSLNVKIDMIGQNRKTLYWLN